METELIMKSVHSRKFPWSQQAYLKCIDLLLSQIYPEN